MEISLTTQQAYSEVYEFLELLDDYYKNQIPKELIEHFKNKKDNSYKKNIDLSIPMKDQDFKKETLAIIALLNLNYWCKDENEKKQLKEIYHENEIAFEEELREKYDPDNIFKKRKIQIEPVDESTTEQSVALVEYKESIFTKIKNWFKRTF